MIKLLGFWEYFNENQTFTYQIHHESDVVMQMKNLDHDVWRDYCWINLISTSTAINGSGRLSIKVMFGVEIDLRVIKLYGEDSQKPSEMTVIFEESCDRHKILVKHNNFKNIWNTAVISNCSTYGASSWSVTLNLQRS